MTKIKGQSEELKGKVIELKNVVPRGKQRNKKNYFNSNSLDTQLDKLCGDILELEQDVYMTEEVVNQTIGFYSDVEVKLKNNLSSIRKEPESNVNEIDNFEKQLQVLSKKVTESFIVIWELFQEIHIHNTEI